jgi:rod shape determining protein RodA
MTSRQGVLGRQGLLGEAVDRIGGEPISARMARKAPIRHLDLSLLTISVLLAAYGVVMVYSATLHRQQEAGLDETLFLKRQLVYAMAGVLVLFVMSTFDYRYLKGFSPFVYGATIIGLLIVLTPLGEVQKGASRWIDFGAFQMQPSELAKIALIITVSAYLTERMEEVRVRDIAVCLALAAFPMFLIFLEPDLGTTMVFVALTATLLLIGGAKIRHFIALGILGLFAILLALELGAVEDYQVQRITAFLDPNPDVRSVGYNLTQSKIAIGSGGFRGKGIGGENTQTSLDFVPEQHTDFIFTAVGEQLGFVGSATLLGLFAFLLWRAIRIATMARDLFGVLLATGCAALWAFQLFVNIGMTMGIMPITGIPLPFISFGGSSLLTNFAAVGLLMNIHMRRFL